MVKGASSTSATTSTSNGLKTTMREKLFNPVGIDFESDKLSSSFEYIGNVYIEADCDSIVSKNNLLLKSCSREDFLKKICDRAFFMTLSQLKMGPTSVQFLKECPTVYQYISISSMMNTKTTGISSTTASGILTHTDADMLEPSKSVKEVNSIDAHIR